MYPFEELAGHFVFDNPEGIRQGFYVSPETDYQEISGILTNEIRRDFTFVHPEFFLEDKYQIDNGTVKLNNVENYQEYKVMFLTGCETISYKTLDKLKEFYESGGTIISTTQLPFKSSEIGMDHKVVDLITGIFDLHPQQIDSVNIHSNSNSNSGHAFFIPQPDKSNIQKVLDEHINPDVSFSPNPILASDFGKFNYIHKIKDGRNILYFSNSSDETIATEVFLRGNQLLELWNPHTGEIEKDIKIERTQLKGEVYTKFSLELKPVHSVFYLSGK
jgi:hypothetical protein